MASPNTQNNTGKRRGPKGPSKYHLFINNFMKEFKGDANMKYSSARRAWKNKCDEEAANNLVVKKPRGRPRSTKKKSDDDAIRRPKGRPRSLQSYLKEFRESYQAGKLCLAEKGYSDFVKSVLTKNQKNLLVIMEKQDNQIPKKRGRPKGSKNKKNQKDAEEKPQEENMILSEVGEPEVLKNLNFSQEELDSIVEEKYAKYKEQNVLPVEHDNKVVKKFKKGKKKHKKKCV